MQLRTRLSRRRLFCALPALPLALTSAARAATRELFVIARSLNANVVCYAAQLSAGGELDVERPLLAYWRMHAERGQREELSWLEWQFAYGWSLLRQTPRLVELQLAAFPERNVVVRLEASGGARAEVRIQERPAILRRIFVQLADGPGLRVRHVDLSGVELATGQAVQERIVSK